MANNHNLTKHSISEELEELKKLKDDDAISDFEYNLAKSKILQSELPLKIGNSKYSKWLIIAPIIMIAFSICIILGINYSKQKKEEEQKILIQQQQEFEAQQKSISQRFIDEAALSSFFKGITTYAKCMGTGTHSYLFISNCLTSSDLITTKFKGTSCDEELNLVVEATIDAKEHCGKAGFYEDGEYIKRGISIETYTNETTACNAATDQFKSLPTKCGEVYSSEVIKL